MTNFLRAVIERVGRFFYDPTAAHYVRTSDLRPVLNETLADVVQRRIDDAAKLSTSLSSQLAAGKISVAEWRDGMAVEIRRATSQLYALGNGGWRQIDPADRQAIAERLRSEMGYLRDFAKEIVAGNLSDAQIQARAQMYTNGLRTAYWQGEQAAKETSGFTEEMRVLNPAEHCEDCIGLAGYWAPIGTLPAPGDGSTQCLSNCQCGMIFR